MKAGEYLGQSSDKLLSFQGGLGSEGPGAALWAALPTTFSAGPLWPGLELAVSDTLSGMTRPLSLVMVLRRRCSRSPDTEPFRGLAGPLGWMVVVLRDLPCTNHRSVFWTVDQSQRRIIITCTPMAPPLPPDTFLPPRTSLRL